MRMDLPHLPALRRGKPYDSLDNQMCAITAPASRWRGQPGQRRHHPQGSRPARGSRAALKQFTCAQLLEICRQAAEVFVNEHFAAGRPGSHAVTAAIRRDPFPHERPAVHDGAAEHEEHRTALSQMRTILNGLTRGLDLGILDAVGRTGRRADQFFPDDALASAWSCRAIRPR